MQTGLSVNHWQLEEYTGSIYGLITGEYMCATGGKYYTEADRCDGRFDCEDQSDERDCPSKKTYSILL